MKKIILVILLISQLANANDLNQIMDVLKYIETNNNPKAIGDGGKSFGILQIQQKAIDDVNERFGTSYIHEDAFDIACAEEIFELYITIWGSHLEAKEKRPLTDEDIVRIWNGGPRGYKRKGTLDYLEKYKKRNLEMSKNKRRCYIGGRMGMIVATYRHTVDVYVFKRRTVMYGVSTNSIHIIPLVHKCVPDSIQLALAL